MKKSFLLTLAFVLLTSATSRLFAQHSKLYIPKEIKRAYQNGSRSFDGNPGEYYFQNRTDYAIDVEFDPFSRVLKGSEKIIFTNNSSDTLRRVVIRLNANILKKGATRKKQIDPSDANDGLQLTQLIYNSYEFDLENKPPYLDQNNLYVRLPEGFLPSTSAEFEIDWNYIFQANSNIREGRYHETSYFIAYWYPKIAVYDDIEGWDRHVYNAEQEFYHEYGSFDVNITLPADFYVWSSGILQNGQEVLSKEKFELLEESKTTDEVIKILEEVDVDKGDLPRNINKKTWQFKAEYLPDFAFALSDTYLWDATSVKVGDKRVSISAVYFRDSKDFHEVAEISRNTIKLLSEKVIGIDYPYPQMTAFNGHFGMEFPMMVNDGDGKNRNETLFITSHEIAHTYFPFYVGTNEQKYAWMDEGLVSFLPKEIEDGLSADDDYNAFSNNIRTYSYYAGSKYDMPVMVPSDQLTGLSYMYISYSRAGVAFYVLKDILGAELFQKCLKSFINRWAGKHPTAYDFFYTFEDISGQDLSWFWQLWFFDFGYPDLAVKAVNAEADGYKVEVKRIGDFPVPVNLIITFKNGSTKEVTKSAKIWESGEHSVSVFISTENKIKQVEINTTSVPDIDNSNNSFTLE